jgi:hypothetical protein
MFISNSALQTSTWGWTNNTVGGTGIPNSDSYNGEFTGYTVANDGYAYAAPLNIGTTLVNKVMILSPGACNTRYSNYSPPVGFFANADGSPSKPDFTVGYGIINSKGILAPNGKIYYIRQNGQGLCILTPNSGDCTWEFYTTTTTNFGSTVSGLILGKDGKLYILPGAHTGSPYVSKLFRLDISGPSIVEEVSWYDGTPGTTLRNVTALYSIGTFVQLTSGSSMTEVSVGKMVNVTGNDDTIGVLNQENDTFITAVDTINKTITLSEEPAVPFNNKPLQIGDLPRKPTNTYSNLYNGAYRGRLNTFFDKVYLNGDYPVAPNVVYNTVRNPQANGGPSAASGINPIYTAFLDPDPSSNKIYMFPYSGTQIWWIDPDNWSNALAMHTSKNLTLSNLGIGKIGTVVPYGRVIPYLGQSIKKISSLALGPDNKFYTGLALGSDLPTSLAKVMSVDPQSKSVSFVTSATTSYNDTCFSQSSLNVLPNGSCFNFSNISFAGTSISYRTFQEISFTESNAPRLYKVDGFTYGVGQYYPRKTYSAYITGNGLAYQYTGTRQASSVLFGSDSSVNGKVITAGNRLAYGIEYLSVKGFYTGVTNFNLMDSDYLDIPDNLADLPTSKYNIRSNTPL